ncbi:MAG: response regulator [Pirellulaceae bacterium]|nr:response regulator [Pirellulaceae bacterium]
MATILVADDSTDLRELAVAQLRKRGYATLAAKNGVEAVEMAKSSKPGLILMDLNMPECDGWEAMAQLKQDEELKKIPIIALTAYSLPGDKIRAINAGCEAFHSKPPDTESLFADIERFVRRDDDSAIQPS